MTRPEAALIDELEFRSYVHNRMQFPDVSPERWALIFSNVPEMEERYLDMLSTGNILDVAPRYWCPTSGNEYQHPGKCPECGDTLEIVEDVADRATGNAPVTDGLQVGDTGVSDGCEQMRALQTEQGQDLTANGGRNQSARSCENTADSRILDRHGDDRFADNIQRALEGLPQNGDAEEEEAAAEEGAAIEASGYMDPVYERNGR